MGKKCVQRVQWLRRSVWATWRCTHKALLETYFVCTKSYSYTGSQNIVHIPRRGVSACVAHNLYTVPTGPTVTTMCIFIKNQLKTGVCL